jgi:hypothetical protein
MNERLITSQAHIDDCIVSQKIAAKDYAVTVGKVITIDGIACRVVVDGHHSLHAAMQSGAAPKYEYANVTTCDREGIDDFEQYLESHWMDGDYRDAITNELVF